MRSTCLIRTLLACLALLLPGAPALAQDPPAAPQSEAERLQKLREMESQIKALAEEVQSLKTRFVLPEVKEYKSLYGLGPAASKVYGIERGLSIGAYGETNLSFLVSDEPDRSHDTFDFVRFVLYAGYKFTDRIIFNAELEVEHAKTEESVSAGAGAVELEFAYLDFLLAEQANIRAGLVLIPLGFINEIHEPPFYFGNRRPEVERRIIPATWRELGAGLYGALLPSLAYRTYVVNSLNAGGLTATDIRDARQEGNRAFADDFAWTGRLDYTGIPGLLVGASFFWGNTGQDQTFAGQAIDANLFLYDIHAQFEYRGLHLRALFAEGHLGDARTLSIAAGGDGPISGRIWGAYGEVAYDVAQLVSPGTRQYLAPFVRYERLDTQADVPSGFTPAEATDLAILTVGASYKPIPTVVIKADYRQIDAERGAVADEVNLGLGFAF